jgi:hypothetical protein
MDPFIEAAGKWEDFHTKLMGDMERALSEALPPRYVVRLGERSYIDYIDPQAARGGELLFKPDLGIGIKSLQAQDSTAGVGTSVLEAAAVDMEGLVETEFREVFLEVHEIDPQQRLVTAVEILSPTNKRPGTVGWYQYERKRKVFLEGHANLVEIDLLRGGRRLPMAQPWPDSPYCVMVLRREFAPRCKVWRAEYRSPLPDIPIPLAPPDAPLELSLQPLVDGVYHRSRYASEIDYALPLRPPPAAAEGAWIEERIRAWRAAPA